MILSVFLFYFCIIIICLPFFTGVLFLFSFNTLFYHRQKKKNIPCPALLFHSIVTKKQSDMSHMLCANFERLCTILQQNDFSTITAQEMYSYKKQYYSSNSTLTFPGTLKNKLLLVFDDGFENIYTNVLPILEKYNFKLSVFPVVGSLGSFAHWDMYKPKKHLSKQQLITMHHSGHEIGSHTLTHPDLLFCSTNKIRSEVTESKKILEDTLGIPIKTISFPFGSWDKHIWEICLEAGYEIGIAYRNHRYAQRYPGILCTTGVYSFSTVPEIIESIVCSKRWSPVHTWNTLMPHFAKGTAVWKFRPEYQIHSKKIDTP